ncbi:MULTISPECIES: DUF3348 family protein [unclassified Acidovorax]|jgi:hypothetical protein|nr:MULTISPECIES: DUF3348 family protein [unclassified Acidovorax]OZA58177.1 MAG: hypothetical protein B7X79_03500 [Acidovorax sp. 17-64-282]HQS21700.1 DUF3348 family protein [Acidovorax defluvii]OYY27212.1 MAG: hypothetical protein B7Y64_12995 [Acidovorax sp. 35-64-16]OYY87539.1 MAG: hypothetical protein B7Y46_01465 [Acidovorax sp. 28-64-14]OYZ44904.1 MAG: hypothetical protein B7Y20_09025 [Acidovorax sp. 16-64-162]
MYLRHRLNSSSLVVLLQQWAGSEGEQVSQQDVAEQLSLWVDAVDAIHVSRALHAIESLPAKVAPLAQAGDADTMDAVLQAAKADVIALITGHGAPLKPMRARVDRTPIDSPDSWKRDDFAAQVQRYLGIQKYMDAKLGAVRAQMRQWLSTGARSVRQLAMLDSVMEQMFHAREQRAWAMLSGYVERRLVYRHKEHQKMLQTTGRADDPQRWRQSGGWLWAFEQDLQALLLAEMQARLQPIYGLLEAARNDKTGQQE